MYDVLHLFAFKTSQDLFIVRNALVINAEAGNQWTKQNQLTRIVSGYDSYTVPMERK